MPPRLPRERALPLFERELVLRDLVAPVERFAVDLRAPAALPVPVDLRVLADLRAADERVAPDADDFARDALDFFAPLVALFAVERDFAGDLRALLERELVEREPLLRPEEDDEPPELVPPPELSVGDHLPDITRCAASATASAMIEPSLVALETTLLAAFSAVSAASKPASRIFLRAAGLALIAAAAAASPAASISLLIAALASLSTVALFEAERDDDDVERELEEPEREVLLRADLAIA